MGFRLEYSTTAKCRPEHVWKKFEKLEEWPWWNQIIGQSRWLDGQPWQKGSRFLMQIVRPKIMTFKPVVLECAPPGKVGWVGKAAGFTGEHWFSFEPQADETTLLKTWEDFSGLSTLFVGSGMKKQLVAMYAAWLDALKLEAERIAREEKARS